MGKLRFRKLHSQIVLAFALLLVLAQAASLFSINRILTRSTHEDINQGIRAGERIFHHVCETHGQQLLQAAKVLSADYAFRQAVGTSDQLTIRSALVNHGARIHAQVLVLAGLDHLVITDTLRSNQSGRPFPFEVLLDQAEREGEATGMVMLGDRLIQLVIVPVLAPVPVAWLAVGIPIEDSFAQNLGSLTGLEISFVAASQEGRGWRPLASTLTDREGLREADGQGTGTGSIHTVAMSGEPFVTLVLSMECKGSQPAFVLLQRSLLKAQAPLRRLRSVLLVITAFSLGGALLASVMFARGMTRPLKALADSARHIQQGDYSRPVDVKRLDEIGSLAGAFNHMMEGLATRENRIIELAYRDQLTGLPNRTLFNDRLDQEMRLAMRGKHPFTVLFVDLDRFREVNDIMGHHIGDQLLIEVANRLRMEMTRVEDVVARLGGDEFGILLPHTDIQGAIVVAQRMSEILQRPVLLASEKVSLGGGIGLAAFPEHGEEIHTLLRHAEQAMYEAKRHNSGYAIFDSSFDTQNPNQLSLIEDLRHAVEYGELELFYQPKLSYRTGAIGQVEALVRWRHPERGLISPGAFIPYAEKTGYIRLITEWAVGAGLKQAEAWRAQGTPLVISINLSARDLMNIDLPGMFAKQLEVHQALPSALTLEITESAIMTDPARAMAILNSLHEAGFRLSIDDFGTGYSSLAYLKKLPVSELKIDQSFVTNMVRDRDDAVICKSTIDLGHNLGLEVVAEGVEDQAALDLLGELGCDLAQGYHIARPLPAVELMKWMGKSPWQIFHG